MSTPRPFRWLFLDLNSYFASVEQQLHPELRGKPVAVVPVVADNTSVIAASIEAKKFGIKTNTRISDARKMCPGIVFITGDHQVYVEVHQKIIAAVETVLPISAVLSIDELACELMGSEQEEANAIALAKKVKAAIYANAGECLHCSVGLAPNRFLAKVATDMQKPDGLVLIREEELPERLFSLKPRDLPGIGARMEERLHRYGIHTMPQLLSLKRDDFRQIWNGILGEQFFDSLWGHQIQYENSETRTIGHSHVLPPEFRNYEGAYLIAQKLTHKAAVRLRRKQFWATEFSLSVRLLDQDERVKGSIKMIECCDDLTMLEALAELWKRVKKNAHPIKVSITLSGFIPDSQHSLSFFDHPRRTNLANAIDAINSRYGKNTVLFASMQKMQNAAPTRIAFTSIPDFSV